jgi:hypothetical protein
MISAVSVYNDKIDKHLNIVCLPVKFSKLH